MTKTELIDRIAENVQLPKYQTEAAVTIFLQCIMDALQAGDKVELRGFGSFRRRRRRPRVGRNPKTGDTVQIPAKQVPWFTAGKALRALVNQPERRPPSCQVPSNTHAETAKRCGIAPERRCGAMVD
jgi:integration host factor subunit beta